MSRSRRRVDQKGRVLSSSCRVVAGIHSCRETLRCRPQDIQEMWFKENPQGELLSLFKMADSLGVHTAMVSLRRIEVYCSVHQGVVLFVASGPKWDREALKHLDRVQLMALDGVVDPRNLGAVMRTAWLMGVPAIFISSVKTSPVSGTVMKVACGAGEHVAVQVCGHLPKTLEELKEEGFWVYGLAGEAPEGLWESPLNEKIVWVLGSEEKGLRHGVCRACDQLVSLYQVEDLLSYNVSVAAALAMGEFCRRHGPMLSVTR